MKYIEDARRRAGRRKSKWNLLPFYSTILFLFLISFSLLKGIESIHVWKYPSQKLTNHPDGIWVNISILSLLISEITPSLICANVICWLTPPARRALDAEAKSHPNTNFTKAQKGLLKIGLWSTCLPLSISIVAALQSWCAKCP
jgi:hypothetical protein